MRITKSGKKQFLFKASKYSMWHCCIQVIVPHLLVILIFRYLIVCNKTIMFGWKHNVQYPRGIYLLGCMYIDSIKDLLGVDTNISAWLEKEVLHFWLNTLCNTWFGEFEHCNCVYFQGQQKWRGTQLMTLIDKFDSF
jgi:hypothetical protein